MTSFKQQFQYDPMYRLVKATGRELTALAMPSATDFANNIPIPNPGNNVMQNYTEYITYDQIGNITLHDHYTTGQSPNWSKEYCYDDINTNNYLSKHDANQTLPDYTYDAHGNITSMPHLSSMQWDYKDRLLATTQGTETTYYRYNSQGERTRKITEKQGGTHNERLYLGGYEIYREYGIRFGIWHKRFERQSLNICDIKLPAKRDEQQQTQVHPRYIIDENKKIAIIECKSFDPDNAGNITTMRYQYSNHLGTVCLELDDTADIISYEEYHPFGTTSYRSGRTQEEVSRKRYKYVGKERDEESGLYYYGARYYADWLCRFVSVDPLQFIYPYLTPYNYGGNKPITHTDIDGMQGTGDEPVDQQVIKTASGSYMNIPASAKVETFGASKIKTTGGVSVSVDAKAAKAFTIDGVRYVAGFNKKGVSLGYFKSTDLKTQYKPVALFYESLYSSDFKKKLLEICFILGQDPNKLLTVMAHETGETFKPNIWNGTTAVGLIQFTDIALKEINNTFSTNYTKDSVAAKTAVEQLDLVRMFYQTPMLKNVHFNKIEDYAVANFAPGFIGKSENTTIFKYPSLGYTQNKGLDLNKDSLITVGEVGAKFKSVYLKNK